MKRKEWTIMNLNIHRPNKLLSLHLRHNHGHTYNEKNTIWEVKKRFTRENKNKQSKTRFSAFFFIKCPIIKINSSSKQYPDVFVSFVQDTINQFSRILWTCWNWVGFGISLLPETAILLEFEPVAAMVTAFAYNALVCISLGSRMLAGQIHRSLSFAEDQPF